LHFLGPGDEFRPQPSPARAARQAACGAPALGLRHFYANPIPEACLLARGQSGRISA
jgi:hypothetical protein